MEKNLQRSLKNIDGNVLRLISTKTQNNLFDRIMPVITHTNDFGQIYMLFALFILYWDKNINAFIYILTALAIGLFFGEGVIKRLVKRKRPFINCQSMLIDLPKTYSFPSGHTTSSFSVLGVVWMAFPRYKAIILVLAVLIAFSRLYLHVHYPTDVLGGIALGIICAALTVWISPDEIFVKHIYNYSDQMLKVAYKAVYSFLIYIG